MSEIQTGGQTFKCSNKVGLLLPIFNEAKWPVELLAFLYLVALLYLLLGISYVVDVFMTAIELIGSKTKTVYITKKDGSRQAIQVPIWSDVVADLSLLTVGSSLPEIFISVIEVVSSNFEAGELGPGVIIGASAFNVLITTAVCIASVPKGEIRKIKDFKVFLLTAVFSIFAHIWLLAIISWKSPGIVEIWEAAVTFIMFPILVVSAWIVEKTFSSPTVAPEDHIVKDNFGETENSHTINLIKYEY